MVAKIGNSFEDDFVGLVYFAEFSTEEFDFFEKGVEDGYNNGLNVVGKGGEGAECGGFLSRAGVSVSKAFGWFWFFVRGFVIG